MRSFLLVLGFVAIPLASACSAFTGVDAAGLIPADDGGSDDSGRSTRDGGTSSRDGGSKTDGGIIAPSLGPDCTALQSCCDFLDTTSAATCRTTALDANESDCSANLSAYQADGVCSDITPPPPPVDSGTILPPVDSGLPLTSNCELLLGCCSAAGADASCLTTAIGGDDSACESLYFTYVLDGVACTTVP
jgi:hypothetical protein